MTFSLSLADIIHTHAHPQPSREDSLSNRTQTTTPTPYIHECRRPDTGTSKSFQPGQVQSILYSLYYYYYYGVFHVASPPPCAGYHRLVPLILLSLKKTTKPKQYQTDRDYQAHTHTLAFFPFFCYPQSMSSLPLPSQTHTD